MEADAGAAMKPLATVALIALLALQVPSRAQQPTVDPFAVPNAVVAAWSEWGKLYEHRLAAVGMNGVDLQEQRAFNRLMDRMNDLKKFVKSQYQ
jgi:hypothetical protein